MLLPPKVRLKNNKTFFSKPSVTIFVAEGFLFVYYEVITEV